MNLFSLWELMVDGQLFLNLTRNSVRYKWVELVSDNTGTIEHPTTLAGTAGALGLLNGGIQALRTSKRWEVLCTLGHPIQRVGIRQICLPCGESFAFGINSFSTELIKQRPQQITQSLGVRIILLVSN
uniref:Uncharacterized protein n=1 Tax=Opuntia streptacantha TaxID=393608 RepID=A0A7C8Z976_OPUST